MERYVHKEPIPHTFTSRFHLDKLSPKFWPRHQQFKLLMSKEVNLTSFFILRWSAKFCQIGHQ